MVVISQCARVDTAIILCHRPITIISFHYEELLVNHLQKSNYSGYYFQILSPDISCHPKPVVDCLASESGSTPSNDLCDLTAIFSVHDTEHEGIFGRCLSELVKQASCKDSGSEDETVLGQDRKSSLVPIV